jgi:MFS family permease
LGHVLNVLGATLQVAAFQLPQLIIGRLVNGFGIGLTSTMCPVFLSECAPTKLRGKLVTIGTACNVAAFCLSGWIGYAVYFREGPMQWRLPLAVQLLFPFIILPTLVLVPESPRWLLLVDREDEAKQVIARFMGQGIDEPAVVKEFRSIQGAIKLEHKDRVSTRDVLMFRDKTQNMRRLLLGCGTQFIQQFSGINALGEIVPPTTALQDVGSPN